MVLTELDWAAKIVCETAPFGVSPVIFELGAHHGNDTATIYDACQIRPRYVAVEADPRNVPYLVNRIGPRNVHVAHYAIASYCGTATLHLSSGPGATGSSSIRPPKEHLTHFPTTTFDEAVEVPAITLDALAERYMINYGVDLIWSDLQGAERDMIAGGVETLKRSAYLLCECDAVEMYEGQVTREGLLDLLPDWEVIAEWPANANVLLRNRAKL
jgi:FkbM family methyltransferase